MAVAYAFAVAVVSAVALAVGFPARVFLPACCLPDWVLIRFVEILLLLLLTLLLGADAFAVAVAFARAGLQML